MLRIKFILSFGRTYLKYIASSQLCNFWIFGKYTLFGDGLLVTGVVSTDDFTRLVFFEPMVLVDWNANPSVSAALELEMVTKVLLLGAIRLHLLLPQHRTI